MAHATGIPPSSQLLSDWKQLASLGGPQAPGTFSQQILLTNDQAIPKQSVSYQANIDESVFFRKTKEFLSDTEPCFLLLRCGTTRDSKLGWAFISYVPATASIRLKMIYAATRTSLVQHLNGILSPGQLLVNSQVHSREEFTKDWLKQEMTHSTAVGVEAEKLRELVMNDKEKMVKEMRLEAARVDYGTQTRQAHAASLQFPWTEPAKRALMSEYPAQKNFLIFKIENEQIHYCPANSSGSSDKPEAGSVMSAASKFGGATRKTTNSSIEASEDQLVKTLHEVLPKQEPRYVLIRFPPQAASPDAAHLFAYLCPTTAPVQQKMIYASARTPFYNELMHLLKQKEGDAVQCKRGEIGDLEELTVEVLCDLVGCPLPASSAAAALSNATNVEDSKKEETQHGFVKKIAVPGSGGRRLVGRI